MGAYRYILATGIGLTEEEKRAACASDKVDDKSVDMATMVDENPLYNKFLRHSEFGGQEEKVELNLVKPENTQSGESPASRARARTIEVSIDNSDTRTTPDTRVTPGGVSLMENSQTPGIDSVVEDNSGRIDTLRSESRAEVCCETAQSSRWCRVPACFRKIDAILLSWETRLLDAFFAQLCSCLPEMMKDREWFRITLPYMLSIFYTDANNFGLLPSLLPLALANATTSMERQMNLLQVNFQVGAFALVCADTLTFYIDIPLRYPLLAYLTLSLFIYSCASNKDALSGYHDHELDRIAIVICCAYILNCSMSGYILIMAWRKASAEVPAQNRESSSRMCGYADQVSSFVGSVIALPIVLSSGSCM